MAEKKLRDLKRAVLEARRFIRAAEAAIMACEENEYINIYGGAATASAKRASMDLSRALVPVRNPDKKSLP